MGTTSASEIEESVTGQAALTEAEYEAFGRALSKGYGQPYDAYKVGIRDGIDAALKAVGERGVTDVEDDEPEPAEKVPPRVIPITAETFPGSNAGTKSGISLGWFGEDGEWAVAFGHLKQADFVVAVDEHEDTECDPDEVEHRWAVTEIDDSLPEDHDFHRIIRWDGVTETTEHAFPVTVLNTQN